jgi:dihydrofolate reductase
VSGVTIALVAAVAKNGVIGRDNKLLWRLKTDLRRFRDLTTGKPIVMGRKTFESIGRPLPNRDNIVVTRDPVFAAEGVTVAHSLEDGLREAETCAAGRGVRDVMIAGGGEIYAQTIGGANRLHITEVDLEPDGDALFPRIDGALWRETARRAFPRGPDDEAAFAFVDYIRR